MAKIWVVLLILLLCSSSEGMTDDKDVSALNDMYRAMRRPKQLKGWTAKFGDPCFDKSPWTGIRCSGSSVVSINLHGLHLEGFLGGQLNDLTNLQTLDMSMNRFGGSIPDALPPNVTKLDLSSNHLMLGIPSSLKLLNNLLYLNLSRNHLSGYITNEFHGLNLKELDLTCNNFSGLSMEKFTGISSVWIGCKDPVLLSPSSLAKEQGRANELGFWSLVVIGASAGTSLIVTVAILTALVGAFLLFYLRRYLALKIHRLNSQRTRTTYFTVSPESDSESDQGLIELSGPRDLVPSF